LQAQEIFRRTQGRQDLQRDAMGGQDLLVAVGVTPERAAVGSAGDREGARRRRADDPDQGEQTEYTHAERVMVARIGLKPKVSMSAVTSGKRFGFLGDSMGKRWDSEAGPECPAVRPPFPGTTARPMDHQVTTRIPTMKTTSSNKSRMAWLALLGIFLGALVMSGCQTMNGVGKDVERAGEKIQENSKK